MPEISSVTRIRGRSSVRGSPVGTRTDSEAIGAAEGTREPEVDVLIPVYNAEKTLRSSLGSILDQTLSSISIIAVDDGSTDASPQLLEEIAHQDSRVRVLRQQNRGIVEALNIGLRECRAPIIARHDADDISHRERLAVQLSYLRQHLDCVAVGCWAEHIDEQGRRLGTFARPEQPAWADEDWIPVREPYLIHPFLMARTTAVAAVGGYRHVVNAEDADLYWRLREVGRLHNIETELGFYRIHAGSIMSKSVRHGRQAALSSELAGLSARRRRSGLKDLSFTPEAADRVKSLSTCAELVGSQPELAPREEDQLRLGMAAKLMDLCEFRPYELEAADCHFISCVTDALGERFTPEVALGIADRRVRSAMRLLKRGRIGDALKVSGPHLYGAVLRAVLRKVCSALSAPRGASSSGGS